MIIAARSVWDVAEDQAAEIARLRERVAELEADVERRTTYMHEANAEITRANYATRRAVERAEAAERDAARWLKSATEICDQFCGKRYHGACISTDCPRRVKVDAAMAPRSGGEGEHNV